MVEWTAWNSWDTSDWTVVCLVLNRDGNKCLLHGGDEEREACGGRGWPDVYQHRVGRVRWRRRPKRHPDYVWCDGGQSVRQSWCPHVRMPALNRRFFLCCLLPVALKRNLAPSWWPPVASRRWSAACIWGRSSGCCWWSWRRTSSCSADRPPRRCWCRALSRPSLSLRLRSENQASFVPSYLQFECTTGNLTLLSPFRFPPLLSERNTVWKMLNTSWPSWVWSGTKWTPASCECAATPSPLALLVSAPPPWRPSPIVSATTGSWTNWRPLSAWTGQFTKNIPSG